MPNEVTNLLRSARDLITPPDAWTRHYFWRNSKGLFQGPSSEAVCWCARGALDEIAARMDKEVAPCNDLPRYEAVKALEDTLTSQGLEPRIAYFNDTHTHEEVLALFDAAIALAETSQEFPSHA